MEPESNDEAKLIRQIRIKESLKEEIERCSSNFDLHFKEDEDGVSKLSAESAKIFELQTNYLKVMDSILSSCSSADFKGFSAEKFRIQELVSNIRATIDNLNDKKSERDRSRNKIKLTPIDLEVFAGTGPYIDNQFING